MIKSKQKYETYEYIYKTQEYGEIIISAYVENKDNKKWLNVWLRTSDNMGLSHFVVGQEIEDASELNLLKMVKDMAEYNYFDTSIELALEIENPENE